MLGVLTSLFGEKGYKEAKVAIRISWRKKKLFPWIWDLLQKRSPTKGEKYLELEQGKPRMLQCRGRKESDTTERLDWTENTGVSDEMRGG